MLSVCLLLTALTTASASVSLPPTPRFRHYSVADGLPSSQAYSVVQDHDGYIWVGTGDGLARFDGRDFKLYRHDPTDPASLPANDVSSLLVDQQGRLWVGGEGTGLNRLDPVSGGFTHWLHDEDQRSSLAANDIMGLAQTPDGSIWVGVYSAGVHRLLADATGFAHLRHIDGDAQSIASDNVLTLHADAQGRLWIGTDRGVDVRLPDGEFRHIKFTDVERPPLAWQINGDGDDVRIATNVGLFVLGADWVARRMPQLTPSHDAVWSSLRTPDGRLWIGARGVLHLIDPDGTDRVFKTQPLLEGGLPAELLLGMSMDNEGGLWLATLDGGLVYLGPHWQDFTRFSHVPEQEASLASSRVRALAVDARQRLLVGGPGGQLDRLEPDSGVVEHLAEQIGVAPKSVVAVLIDDQQRIWLAPERGGLRVLEQGRIRELSVDAFRIGVHEMVLGDDGSVYAAPTAHGVYRIDPRDWSVTALTLADPADTETNRLRWHQKRLWRASAAGLSVLDAATMQFRRVPGVESGAVTSFAFRGQDCWLARPDVLERYRVIDGRWQLQQQVDASAGWPAVDINNMTIDARNRVWLTSRVGLWRFDPRSREFRRYGIADGLPSPEFSEALLTLADGTVYAGTLNGVVGFKPTELEDHEQPPQLVLAAASVRRDGQWQALPLSGETLNINWSDGELRVIAHALSYIDPGQNRYRFRLLGHDSSWVDTGARGEREFPDLDAGEYELKVQAAGPSDVWQALPHPLQIHVAAPPWHTPLAWLLYALAAAALIWFVVHAVRRRTERRFHLLAVEDRRRLAEDASAAKSHFLATLGHEIRTPMTGVLGMAELLEHTGLSARQRGLVDTIQHSGEVLLKLVNDALDLARIEAGRLELDLAPFDPGAVLREVTTMHTSLAAIKGLSMAADVGKDVPRQVLGDAVRVRQILMNLVTNAMKFTERGGVQLSLERNADQLLYSVADTGPGLAPKDRERLFKRFEQGREAAHSGSGSGLGLAICRELTTLMDGRIELESKPGSGSVFRVSLPCVVAQVQQPRQPVLAPRKALHKRILLVEDDAVVAEVLSGLLETQGHQVRHVEQSLAAMAEIDIEAPDVMLVDIDLPDVDGLELIRMLRARAEPACARIVIVVVTARADANDEERARSAGADAFLRKPVSGDRLAETLAEVSP